VKGFVGLPLTVRVAGQTSCRRGGGSQNSGGPTVKINSQILLAFLLITLIPLSTIGFLSYFNTKDVSNLRGRKPGTERGALK
jgi:hypothetical protein